MLRLLLLLNGYILVFFFFFSAVNAILYWTNGSLSQHSDAIVEGLHLIRSSCCLILLQQLLHLAFR